ncbi:MarR family winged helix-turn-helix transcriptional regulator [Thermoactinospora rubra]|uniref:MarR family winged helix-turn-helix transcriptional regulator n=1 Tax=Thermoactinospora rubra TaxID=1088767 RepID=UPI000A100A15|nr:MarR family transcriptional regulator [Thermoactinospora rubra]
MLGEGVPSLIPKLARELRALLDAELAPLGLTTQQGAVLMRAALGENKPNQLAALVGTDTAGMTRLVDRLEAKGLVARVPNPADRRSVVIEPTEAGKALLPRVMPAFGKVGGRLLAGFSEEDRATATELLTRMLRNLTSHP